MFSHVFTVYLAFTYIAIRTCIHIITYIGLILIKPCIHILKLNRVLALSSICTILGHTYVDYSDFANLLGSNSICNYVWWYLRKRVKENQVFLVTVLDVNKCLEHIRYSRSLCTCAPISVLASNARTSYSMRLQNASWYSGSKGQLISP